MSKHTPKMRVDNKFYDMYKKSGYSSSVFTRKVVEKMFEFEELKKKDKNNNYWGFKI